MTQINETTPADAGHLLAEHESSVGTAAAEFVSFAIGNDRYGVDIMSVREIKNWSGVSPLAGQPEFVRGILNLRGAMVPIIDLRCRFGQGTTEATATHIVIIVSIEGQLVGLLADQVLDIVPYEASKIQPVPRVVREEHSDLLSGLVTDDDGMITLIDLSHLVALDGAAVDKRSGNPAAAA